MPPFKERVDVVAMGLEARLEAPVKMSIMKKAGCLVAWRDADMERRAMRCSSLASTRPTAYDRASDARSYAISLQSLRYKSPK